MSEIKYTSLGSHDVIRPGDEFLLGSEWRNHSESTYGHCVGHNTSRRPIRPTHQTNYEEVPGSRTTQDTVVQPQRERIAYEELQPGTEVQPGDQYRNTQGRWVEYSMDTSGVPIVGPTTMARRPIETAQQAIDQPQRERIAYEELQPGDRIQPGDELKNGDGRWQPYVCLTGLLQFVQDGHAARRPYNISTILEIGDALANAQKAATQLQAERDEARTERDLARSEVARLSTELWARKPLEDRVTSLTDELAQAREEIQNLLKTITENADQFAVAGCNLQHERDEARAKSDRLQGLIDDLLDEPTARQVQDMLRTWATELDWSAGCFDSVGREQIDTIQKTLIALIERIETMLNPEGGTDGE